MAIGKWKKFGLALAVCISFSLLAASGGQKPGARTTTPSSPSGSDAAISLDYSQLQWTPMVPEMGSSSPMRAVLHEHPTLHSSQFLIRLPPNFHVPAHYHTVNETHTVIEGSFIIQVDGKRTELQPGGFNYTPAKVVHEAWTPKDKGALIFVTVDGAYDLHPAASPGAPAANP
ncbi:MAG: cupin domain-containing protein [Candidatus Sulfotelmatobacter sp.]